MLHLTAGKPYRGNVRNEAAASPLALYLNQLHYYTAKQHVKCVYTLFLLTITGINPGSKPLWSHFHCVPRVNLKSVTHVSCFTVPRFIEGDNFVVFALQIIFEMKP